MTRRCILLPLMAIALLFANDATAQVRPGDRLAVTAETLDGTTVAIGVPGDEILVIEFWATWCRPCLRALPQLAAFDAANDDVRVIAISIDNRMRPIERATAGLVLDVVWDRGQALLAYFAPPTIPTTFVVDRDGVVRAMLEGFESIDDVIDAVDRIRGGDS